MNESRATCPLCQGKARPEFRRVENFRYFHCQDCDFIFIDGDVMREIDEGRQICAYNEQYWNSELSAARERAFGPALARVAEVVLYCQIPIKRFIDIGTGYLLDSLSWVLPSSRALFHGVELFPPELTLRTRHENYIVGSLASYSRPFQCGSCIEVAEHLTPQDVVRHGGRSCASLGAERVLYFQYRPHRLRAPGGHRISRPPLPGAYLDLVRYGAWRGFRAARFSGSSDSGKILGRSGGIRRRILAGRPRDYR